MLGRTRIKASAPYRTPQLMERLLEDGKREPGVKRNIALSDIIDYRLLREVVPQVER